MSKSSFSVRLVGCLLLATFLGVQGASGAGAGDASSTPKTGAEESAAQIRGEAYARLMRALLAVRRGAFGSAADEVHRALELEPDSPDLLIEAAELLLWAGRASESERLARRSLELAPDHQRALRFLADLAATRALGPRKDAASREEAIRLIERLLAEGGETDSDMLRLLTQLHIEGRDLDGALDATRRILQERPGDLEAIQTLTQLLLRSGREREALEGLLEFVSRHSYDDDLVRLAEQLTNNLQAWELAVDTLGTGAPYPTDHEAILPFYGEALLRVGRYAEAIVAVEHALTDRPGDLRLRKDLSLAYRGMGRLADAVDLLRGLAADAPDYPFFFQLLGEALTEQNDVDGALAAFETALIGLTDQEGAAGQRDAIRLRMVVLHFGNDEFTQARTLLGSMELAEGPRGLELRCRMAIAEEQWSEAREFARRLRSEERQGIAAMLEGEIAVHERRWSKAEADFEEVVRRLGHLARRAIAEVYRDADRPQDGLDLLREWSAAEPGRAEARFALGVYYYELDRFEESEAELRETFRLDPAHAPALNFLGYGLAERKTRLEEALGMIERALAADTWNGAYLDSLGWVYYQMGRFEEAVVPLERAAREMPHDPTVLEHLGDVYLSLGERANALVAWNRALAAGPESAESLRVKIQRERVVAEAESANPPDRDRELPIAPPR